MIVHNDSIEEGKIGRESGTIKLMNEIDSIKDKNTATYKRLEDLRREKNTLTIEEEKLKKEKQKETTKLNENTASSNFEELQ
jgi:FtsZ-binding cell division protein ZapB